ncbi:hypothetical protein DBT_1997 [Dissulfuribacter thermophilus]|uniref:Uncharacterized protein n=1 Tax=Dissulfuribacter thermophilus TaxID=1156395 RepID=A0A1B9F427_9BACT|nr:hypothetical protein [Dissulfuribacter thermophilus]OCC14682.1 hypothetical protein DBT_1997 [Dissulfuribacter thermophilus]
MKNIINLFVIMICCFIPSISEGAPILDVNQHTFSKGKEAIFSIGNKDSFSEPVDIYIAFKVPGDDALYFWPSGSTNPEPCLTDWLPQSVPLTPFLSYTFTGNEPEGEYRLYSAFLRAGSISPDDIIGNVAEISFDYKKGPVLNVIPYNGQSFSNISPVFSISFISPVDLESIKWNSSIVIESLVSGKQATTYSENGALWVRLYIPDTDGSGEMWIMHKVSKNEEALVTLETDGGGSTLTLPIHPVQIEGQTFTLHHGGHYRFTINFLDGARLLDGTSLAGITLGPIEFRIE